MSRVYAPSPPVSFFNLDTVRWEPARFALGRKFEGYSLLPFLVGRPVNNNGVLAEVFLWRGHA